MKDIHSNVSSLQQSIAPATINATTNGSQVDLAGYEGADAHVMVGTITDGTHTPKLQEASVSGGPWNDVAAADQIGSFSNLASNVDQHVGYIGGKEFLRVVVTVTPGATGGVYGAGIVLGVPRHAPVSI